MRVTQSMVGAGIGATIGFLDGPVGVAAGAGLGMAPAAAWLPTRR